jgi:hypothetical protein
VPVGDVGENTVSRAKDEHRASETTDAWTGMRDVADDSKGSENTVLVEAVTGLLGTEVGADIPLMSAGIDSFAASELARTLSE